MPTLTGVRPDYWSNHFTSLSLDEGSDAEKQLDFSNQAVAIQTYSYVLEACGQLGGKRVLDCGFGTGELARMCSLLGGTVDAFDLVRTRIPELQSQCPNVSWSSADLGKWELPPEQQPYDVIVACEVMQYVDFDAVIATLTDALTEDGRLIVFIPNADCEIVQRSTARFDNQYVGVSVASLTDRFERYAANFRIAYRGIRFQKDQSLVPYAADSWKLVFPGPDSQPQTQAPLAKTVDELPANRLQIVLSR